jgi:hypothetical protein
MQELAIRISTWEGKEGRKRQSGRDGLMWVSA